MDFSYYSGNIRFTKCLGHVNYYRLLESIMFPKKEIKEIIDLIRLENDSKIKRELKHKLFSFTPTAFIQKNKKRCYDNISKWNNVMQIDFDKYDSKVNIEEKKLYLFEKHKFILCLFISPSGNGLKGLAKIDNLKDKEHFKAINYSMSTTVFKDENFDTATKNAVLPMFLSYDVNALFRAINETDTYIECDYNKKEYVRLNDENNLFTGLNNKNNTIRTIKIFKDKINNIVSNGHPQVCSACLILGSRVNAGYIDLNAAENLAKECILNNSYLSKDFKGYIKTAMWHIEQGFNNGPKFY